MKAPLHFSPETNRLIPHISQRNPALFALTIGIALCRVTRGRYWSAMPNISTLRLIVTAAALLMLSACAGGKFRPVSDAQVRVGRPYTVSGRTYVPAPDPTYDMLGYASWYGRESGNRTASGEKFRPDWITAAHTTLPLPTYVEVTALDTGRRIIVRINDRGPFVAGPRIIDLSRGAAERLGIKEGGHARVRVVKVEPSENDRERLRHGKPARDLPPLREDVLRNLRGQLAAAG
jgi:rare lipoprotein A